MNKNDSALSIIKSIKPVQFSFSKQAKTYEKFFSSSSIKHLIKNANKKVKVAQRFMLPTIKEQTKVNSDLINIKIKSSFNYVTELSSLKNFQVSSMKKKKITEEDIERMKLYKELFYITKEKIVDMDFRKKRYQKIKDKYLEYKSYGVKQVTLDPGKYHPKYDILYKRYPVAVFGYKERDVNKIEKNENLNSTQKENNDNTDDKKLNKNNSESNLNIKKNKMKLKSDIKMKNKKESKSVTNRNNIGNNVTFRNMNVISLYKTAYNMNKYNYFDGNIQIQRVNSFYFVKKNKSINKFNKTITKRRLLLKKSSSATDINKIRCPVVFNRMPGRERKIIISEKYNEANYSPNYEITRPHIPATIFKHSFDYSKFKKFVIGKIIRSYCFTPDNYFIIEINKNMENANKQKSSNKRKKDDDIINYY